MRYNFGGVSPGNFAQPTSVETVTVIGGPEDESANINRSKDSAIVPPPFGSPSAYTPNTGEPLTPNISSVRIIHVSDPGNTASGNPGFGNPNSGSPAAYGNPGSGGASSMDFQPGAPVNLMDIPPPMDNPSPGAVHVANSFTSSDSMFQADGSIGTLSIPSLNITGRVFGDDSPTNLDRGIGHISFTSAWDGNVGMAAHNRGATVIFGQIHTMQPGDRIEYRTVYGVRVYEVFFVGQIYETDLSRLTRTQENILTLITCVRDRPAHRWCIQAREVVG